MFKKVLIIGIMFALVTGLCSCEAEDSNSSGIDYQTVFSSMSELAEYIVEEGESNENISLNNAEIQNASGDGVMLYEPDYLPLEFSLDNISLTDSYIYYTYYTDELKTAKESKVTNIDMELAHTVNFTWAYGFDGQESLQSKINYWDSEGWPVNEISNKLGYYYYDSDVYYNIFWCEDGYCFELQIPTSVGTVDPETHEYSGEDVFALKKTFYPFDDNTVAE